MTGLYGEVCDWCGHAFEASLWGPAFWCDDCRRSDYLSYIRAFAEACDAEIIREAA